MNATTLVSNPTNVSLRAATDDALLAMIRDGSRPAVAELYARHAPSLRAIGKKRLGQRDGEDIAQDVFVVVLEIARGARFAPAPGRVGAWLRSVAIRMAARKSAADFETELVDADEMLSDAPVDGERDVVLAADE